MESAEGHEKVKYRMYGEVKWQCIFLVQAMGYYFRCVVAMREWW